MAIPKQGGHTFGKKEGSAWGGDCDKGWRDMSQVLEVLLLKNTDSLLGPMN
jgi:hypothetical protein